MIYAAFMINKSHTAATAVREAVREQRREAYALLSVLYRRIFGKDTPPIARSADGKPYFTEEGAPEFNISHSEGAYLVAIDTDGIPVGVDIQIEKSAQMAKRVGERFPFVCSVSDGGAIENIDILLATRTEDGITFAEYKPQARTSDGSFFSKWALCEAILKAEGGGFRSAGILDGTSHLKTLCFKYSDFYISIASN